MGEGYGPIPNQRINCATTIKLPNGEKKTLYPGTYVRAIRKTYIPHNHPFEDFDDSVYVAVFSPYGLGLVDKDAIDWNVY